MAAGGRNLKHRSAVTSQPHASRVAPGSPGAIRERHLLDKVLDGVPERRLHAGGATKRSAFQNSSWVFRRMAKDYLARHGALTARK
jgi:hypothetical protein